MFDLYRGKNLPEGKKSGLKHASQILKNIEGVGDKRARALLAYFKKVENIKNATVEEIMQVEGYGEETARAVKAFFEERNEI